MIYMTMRLYYWYFSKNSKYCRFGIVTVSNKDDVTKKTYDYFEDQLVEDQKVFSSCHRNNRRFYKRPAQINKDQGSCAFQMHGTS
jgi:hypothetical protein